MFSKYEIKNANGEVVYRASDADTALAYYYMLRNATGYAEAWYDGRCFFKTM